MLSVAAFHAVHHPLLWAVVGPAAIGAAWHFGRRAWVMHARTGWQRPPGHRQPVNEVESEALEVWRSGRGHHAMRVLKDGGYDRAAREEWLRHIGDITKPDDIAYFADDEQIGEELPHVKSSPPPPPF